MIFHHLHRPLGWFSEWGVLRAIGSYHLKSVFWAGREVPGPAGRLGPYCRYQGLPCAHKSAAKLQSGDAWGQAQAQVRMPGSLGQAIDSNHSKVKDKPRSEISVYTLSKQDLQQKDTGRTHCCSDNNPLRFLQ